MRSPITCFVPRCKNLKYTYRMLGYTVQGNTCDGGDDRQLEAGVAPSRQQAAVPVARHREVLRNHLQPLIHLRCSGPGQELWDPACPNNPSTYLAL